MDDADFPAVSAHRWTAVVRNGRLHCVQRAAYTSNGAETSVKLHRELLGLTDPKLCVDHIDGNPLNNCRSNLRVVTHAQNMLNHAAMRDRKRSAGSFIGVSFITTTGDWVAAIGKDRKQYTLGRFDRPEEAARAYDSAAVHFFGDFAALNFPNEIPKPFKYEAGTPTGERHHAAKISKETARAIKDAIRSGLSNKEIIARLGVSMGVIHGIRYCGNWASV